MALKKLTYAQLRKIAYVYAQQSGDDTLVEFVNQTGHRGSASDRIFELHPNDEPGFLGDVELVKESLDGLDRAAKAQQRLIKRYQERNAPGAANVAESLRQMSISLNLDGLNMKRPNW